MEKTVIILAIDEFLPNPDIKCIGCDLDEIERISALINACGHRTLIANKFGSKLLTIRSDSHLGINNPIEVMGLKEEDFQKLAALYIVSTKNMSLCQIQRIYEIAPMLNHFLANKKIIAIQSPINGKVLYPPIPNWTGFDQEDPTELTTTFCRAFTNLISTKVF